MRVNAAKPHDRGKNISIIGAIGLVGVVGAMYGEWATDSMAFLSLTLGQLLHVYGCRSETHGAFDFGGFPRINISIGPWEVHLPSRV